MHNTHRLCDSQMLYKFQCENKISHNVCHIQLNLQIKQLNATIRIHLTIAIATFSLGWPDKIILQSVASIYHQILVKIKHLNYDLILISNVTKIHETTTFCSTSNSICIWYEVNDIILSIFQIHIQDIECDHVTMWLSLTWILFWL